MSATCAKGHFLKYTKRRGYSGGFCCDKCGESGGSSRSHHCKICHYDLCNSCNAQLMIKQENNMDCPSGHKLTAGKTNSNRWTCDGCKNRISEGATLYGCRKCNYDLCHSCHETQKINQTVRGLLLGSYEYGEEEEEEEKDVNDESQEKIRELMEKEKITNTLIESMKTENQQNKIEIDSLEQEIEILKQLNIKTRKKFNQEIQEKDKANQREIAKWKQTSSNQETQIAALQEKQKQALAEKHAKSQTILDLKEEIEILTSNNKSATDRQKQSQIKMNAMKEEIKTLKMEAQQRMDEEKEEKERSNRIQNIAQIGMDLEKELSVFKDKYNNNKLQQIFDNEADDLLNKDSNLNKDYNGYKENVDKILICSKSFNKYIQDTDEILKRLTIPDISCYKSWNVNQILLWIKGLEEGRFNKHVDKLRFGLEKSEITGDDLPDLTRGDLAIEPFDIGNFKDRKQLEIYFKSLSNPTPQNDNNVAIAGQETEGSITAYVQ